MAQNVVNNNDASEPNGLCIYELNNDCLIAIADYLDIVEWLILYETSIRFRKIILEGIIPRKFIDFKQIMHTGNPKHIMVYDACDIFQRFGKVMTRFGICGKNIYFKRPGNTEFDEFLQLMLDYCTDGAIREVHIEFTRPKTCRSDFITKTASHFKDVTTLKVKTTGERKMAFLEQWLAVIPKDKLECLELNGIQPFSIEFSLMSYRLPKLEHLKLKNVILSAGNQMKMVSFLTVMPQIKAFYSEWLIPSFFVNRFECIGKLVVTYWPEVAKQFPQSTSNLKCLILYGQLYMYRDFDAAFKMLAQISTFKKLVIEIWTNIEPTSFSEFHTFIQSARDVQFIDCLHVHCPHVIRHIGEIYIEYLTTKVFEFRTCILSSNGKSIGQTITKAIIRNSQKMENLFIPDATNFSANFYMQIIGARKKAIFGLVSTKPLTIFNPNAYNWKKMLEPDNYKPDIVSIVSMPRKEIEYF